MKLSRTHFVTAFIAFGLGFTACFGLVVNKTGLPIPKQPRPLPTTLANKAEALMADLTKEHPAMHVLIQHSPHKIVFFGTGPVAESEAVENQIKTLMGSAISQPVRTEFRSGTYSDKTSLFFYQWSHSSE